jgi:hypothetical protein
LFWNGTENAVSAIPVFTDHRHQSREDVNPLGMFASAVGGLREEGTSTNKPTNQKASPFFGLPRSKLDVDPELDPIDLGLVTKMEAARLFE